MKDKSQKSILPTILIGLFATGMGLLIILISVDIIHTDPESIHAPHWVLTMAGVMFTLAGLQSLSQGLLSPSEQKLPIIQWARYFLTLGMLMAFATVFLWVGFGSGEREFSGSSSVGPISLMSKGNEIIGRIMFGFGGLIATLMTGYYAYTGACNISSGLSDDD